MKDERKRGEIVIYSAKGNRKIEIALRGETLWLSQKEIAELFDTDRTAITRHLNNIFKSGELSTKSNVQKMHIANADRPVNYYSLDVTISVGYRVNSKKATEFRIWANRVIKQYLTKGYAINEKRLLEQRQAFVELQNAIKFIRRSSDSDLLEGKKDDLLKIIDDYAESFSLLYKYDEGKLKLPKGIKGEYQLEYEDCQGVIDELRKGLATKSESSDLFGRENGERFIGITGNIYQSFGGEELYGTVEEKAAHLFYFVIKDHPFFDGNKRIASMLFIYFLDRNGIGGIDKNTIVALALLVALSNPTDKDTMIKIIANLIPARG